MNKNVRFPFRFFLITFMWSWIIWTPLILASLKIIPVSEKILSILTIPVIMIGVYGPLAGALFALHKENDKGSAKIYLRSFLDFRLGWKAYIFPILIFGGNTFIAWFFPELFGKEQLPMLLPSVWLFVPYLLIMILLGGGQEEFGWRGYALPILESKFGVWYANMILGIIHAFWHLPLWFITGTSQTYMNFGGFILRNSYKSRLVPVMNHKGRCQKACIIPKIMFSLPYSEFTFYQRHNPQPNSPNYSAPEES